jgi:5'-3' exonuclease
VVKGDRDMFQCARDGITILLQRARQEGPDEMGAAEVEERYGIPPAIVPDFIALRGDPSDGLPGAKGIGEKTAADLLRRHGSLEAAIAGAIREKPSIRRALLEQADELRAFKDIATLRDAEVELPPDRPTDRAGGAAAARALGLGRLAARLEGD